MQNATHTNANLCNKMYLMDKLLRWLTNVHPSNTDYIKKNKFEERYFKKNWCWLYLCPSKLCISLFLFTSQFEIGIHYHYFYYYYHNISLSQKLKKIQQEENGKNWVKYKTENMKLVIPWLVDYRLLVCICIVLDFKVTFMF